MRTVNIRGCCFTVEAEPSDYWEWIENDHYLADLETIEQFASMNVSFIDAGAWVGAYSLYASRLYKDVYAIEPDPVALDILNKNLAANEPDNMTLYQGALMGHSGTTTIGSTILGCSCTRQTCEQNTVEVPCITLREFCKNIPDPLFIKMDVEGAEAQVLQDWKFFAERKPDVMLSTHRDWWKEGGSDGKAEYEAITRVGKLYKRATHCGSSVHVNLAEKYGDVVFTDHV